MEVGNLSFHEAKARKGGKAARRLALVLLAALGLALLFLASTNAIVLASTASYVYRSAAEVPERQAALVLGAKAYATSLSPVLRDRVEAGIGLMEEGRVSALLLSGDHGRRDYDEVNGMKRYVLGKAPDIAEGRIFLDHAGFDTYDSLVRAKKVFRCDSLVIVTQAFHVARALYIARSLGIDAVGLALPEGNFPRRIRYAWSVREALARTKAFLDVALGSKPRFLGEEIPITGDGRRSWD